MNAPINLSDDQKSHFFSQKGKQQKQVVSQFIKKLLLKLFSKRVIERPNDLLQEFLEKHTEPIFKIYCFILDTILAKELRR